jgi:hypothetical protein
MNLKQLKPRKALNKAFLKLKPNRSEIEVFKTNLIQLLDRVTDKESEEYHKNLITYFLRKTYYDSNHYINTKERTDLVIHNGSSENSSVGVIIETKKPTNKAEMLSLSNINAKAFHEMVLYYMRERISQKNLEIRHLIATNINEWFIFDANIFEKHFAHSKSFVKQFNDFEEGRLSGKTTDFFYKEIAEPFIESITHEIEYTYFDIREYEKPLRNNDKNDDNKLIALYKLLSPEHLLKLPFTNDSNTLDKRFYSELLHIIGLTETKEGSKKIIERSKEGQRNSGSLLENAIIELDSLDKISRLEKPSQFGNSLQERLFNVALELSITWINRILFLKLLEAQLITYHNSSSQSGKGGGSYSFLSLERIQDYDDLNSLFFKVLARKSDDRDSEIKSAFEKVPYLNSSLFEPTDLEHATLFISNLRDDKQLPIHSSTVLKDNQGKKRTGSLSTLEYLFEFLNAYDFTSEGSEEIQEDNKTLINASVLGLIFEKINGYKDGSFFTPGFITMYMCRETIRKAVIQKFNETKNWECKTVDDLYDKIDDRNEANQIVNSIKICDPAVGSGHFLVSALNEIIAVKNDLRILQDREGKRLKEFHIEVVNDELITTDDDGQIFEYNPKSRESQRVQEALFHEKQTIIENCLFGVDINPNSVKICRLRLWIELLKNAYYKTETELETLPNIDINIKCGNSLISRFAIDADLGQALKKSKWTIDSYRIAVDTYRNAHSKEQKREMERLIADIKSDFRSEIAQNDPKLKRLQKAKGELFTLTNQTTLFEKSKKEKDEWNKKVNKYSDEIKKLEAEIEEIKNNKIYENAFEWRFEFPEVLNEKGDFVGFDVVVGNPPWSSKEQLIQPRYVLEKYGINIKNLNIFAVFLLLGNHISRKKGFVNMLIPEVFSRNEGYLSQRKHIVENSKIISISNWGQFPDVASNTISLHYSKIKEIDNVFIYNNFELKPFSENILKQGDLLRTKTIVFSNFLNNNVLDVILKLESNLKLSEVCKIKRGIELGQSSKLIKCHNCQKHSELSTKYYTNRQSTTCKYCSSLIYPEKAFSISSNQNDTSYNTKAYSGKLISKYESNEPLWIRKDLGDIDYKFEIFEKENLFVKRISSNPIGTIVYDNCVSFNTLYSLYSCSIDKKVLLAIINSSVTEFYYKNVYTLGSTLTSQVTIEGLSNVPIPNIDAKTQAELIELAEKAIREKKNNQQADISAIENQIDQLVYQLYNLTDEEIAIIENSVK